MSDRLRSIVVVGAKRDAHVLQMLTEGLTEHIRLFYRDAELFNNPVRLVMACKNSTTDVVNIMGVINLSLDDIKALGVDKIIYLNPGRGSEQVINGISHDDEIRRVQFLNNHADVMILDHRYGNHDVTGYVTEIVSRLRAYLI